MSLFRNEVLEDRVARLQGDVVLQQPGISRFLVLFLVLIVVLIVAWVTLGSYARTETARGLLVTDAATAKVVTLRPGVLTQLEVEEGDFVEAGQRIGVVRLESANEAGLSSVGASLAALDAQQTLTRGQAHLAAERADSQRAQLSATIVTAQAQRGSVESQIALQRELVASTEQGYEQIEELVERGFVSKAVYERRRNEHLTARQALIQLEQQLVALAGEESRAAAELARVEVDRESAVNDHLSAAMTLDQSRARLRSERATVLTAPISGRITALQTAVGRTVDSAKPLMVVVPDESTLQAVIYAPSRAIGFVRAGQEARLLYDAFPYQRFGSFTGRIERVSRTAIDPRELEGPITVEEPVYRVDVALSQQQVEAYGERLALQPGMTLTANIVLERRSFADWLLQPLYAVMRRS